MTYQLVVAHNSHYTQRLNTILARIKRLVALAGALVSKHDIGMYIRVEVPRVGAVAAQDIGKGRHGLHIGGGAAAAVVGGAELDAVAVNVHVGEVSLFALDVEDLVFFEAVAAVVKICVKGIHMYLVSD